VFARPAFAVLIPVLFSGLAAATLALARTPAASPTATVSPSATPTATALTATPTPFVTPVGCGFFAYTPTPGQAPPSNPTAPGAPAAPSGLRALLLGSPELTSGFAVRLMWQDNSVNETCFGVAERVRGKLIGVIGLSPGLAGWATGPKSVDDIPDETGFHCYQVYYGNAAGQSYSNEACVNVDVLPVRLEPTPLLTPSPAPSLTPSSTPSPMPSLTGSPTPTPTGSPTPTPDACRGEGPVGAPGAPNPPTGLHASLASGSDVCEGFVVRLRWEDNAGDELCYGIERKVGPADWAFYQSGAPADPSTTGTEGMEDVPQSIGLHCYRVSYGNEAGRSAYSDEACVLVEVVPTIVTTTPLFTPTPAPARPPGCDFERQVGSPRAPSAPSNLRVALRDEPGLPQPSFVDFTWDDNSTDEACFVMSFQGPSPVTEWTGPDQTTFSKAAYAERCGMAGYWCYRVSAANEWGMSRPSNEVCLTIESGVASPAAAVAAQGAAVDAVPTTTGATDDGGGAWWLWALTVGGSVLLGLTVLGLWVGGRRPSSR
jgi:hypothetical protein